MKNKHLIDEALLEKILDKPTSKEQLERIRYYKKALLNAHSSKMLNLMGARPA